MKLNQDASNLKKFYETALDTVQSRISFMDQSADTRTYTFSGAVIYESFQASNTTIDHLINQINKALADGIEIADITSCRSKVSPTFQLIVLLYL